MAVLRESVVPSSASQSVIEGAIGVAAANRVPLVFEPGRSSLTKTLVIPAGMRVKGNGVTLVGMVAGPMLQISEENVIEGLTFKAGVNGVTGISGLLTRTILSDLEFWTGLSFGINATGLLNKIVDCKFGLLGPVPTIDSKHIYVRGGTNENNAWKVRDCAFYNAASTYAVDFGDGIQLEFSGNNVELNVCSIGALHLAGMLSSHIYGNWFEANTTPSVIVTENDVTNTQGNHVVDMHGNFYNLDAAGALQILNINGSCRVLFHEEVGINIPAISVDGMSAVTTGWYSLLGLPAGRFPASWTY